MRYACPSHPKLPSAPTPLQGASQYSLSSCRRPGPSAACTLHPPHRALRRAGPASPPSPALLFPYARAPVVFAF